MLTILLLNSTELSPPALILEPRFREAHKGYGLNSFRGSLICSCGSLELLKPPPSSHYQFAGLTVDIPDIALLEVAAEDDLEVANAFKQHIPNLPLLLVAEEVSLETEKEGPRAWRGCGVSKGR